jgi:hypothetical protein
MAAQESRFRGARLRRPLIWLEILSNSGLRVQEGLHASLAPRRFAVIGSGVNGLSTARMLQRRLSDGPGTVTIYAKALPPDTTSNIAGRLLVAGFIV